MELRRIIGLQDVFSFLKICLLSRKKRHLEGITLLITVHLSPYIINSYIMANSHALIIFVILEFNIFVVLILEQVPLSVY